MLFRSPPPGKKISPLFVVVSAECQCPEGVLACRDHDGECACVAEALLCDGRYDCPQGEDEHHCNTGETCPRGELDGGYTILGFYIFILDDTFEMYVTTEDQLVNK